VKATNPPLLKLCKLQSGLVEGESVRHYEVEKVLRLSPRNRQLGNSQIDYQPKPVQEAVKVPLMITQSLNDKIQHIDLGGQRHY